MEKLQRGRMRTRQGFLGAMAGSMIGSVLAATVLPMIGRKDALNNDARAVAVTIDAPSEHNQDGKLSATTDRRDQEGTGITTGPVSHEVASADFEVEASVHGEPRPAARDNGSDDFFRPSLQPGQVLTDFFSRTFSIEGEGIERSVRLDSGTGSYTVIANARNGDLKFSLVYDMEGMASGKAEESSGTKDARNVSFKVAAFRKTQARSSTMLGSGGRRRGPFEQVRAGRSPCRLLGNWVLPVARQ